MFCCVVVTTDGLLSTDIVEIGVLFRETIVDIGWWLGVFVAIDVMLPSDEIGCISKLLRGTDVDVGWLLRVTNVDTDGLICDAIVDADGLICDAIVDADGLTCPIVVVEISLSEVWG